MIIEVCFAISLMLGIYDCSYSAEIMSFEELNNKWNEIKDQDPWTETVQGFYWPKNKTIYIHNETGIISQTHWFHEWRHAFCHNYWIYHKHTNHEGLCSDPHFKVQE